MKVANSIREFLPCSILEEIPQTCQVPTEMPTPSMEDLKVAGRGEMGGSYGWDTYWNST